MKQMVVGSEPELIALGESLGKCLRPGDLLFLWGELGAGKTTLTKGIARGMGVAEEITSPTFQLKKSYRGRFPLYHLDLYRLENRAQIEVLDPDELMEEGVTVVEWGAFLKERLPGECLEVTLEYGPGEGRSVTMTPSGERFRTLLEELFQC